MPIKSSRIIFILLVSLTTGCDVQVQRLAMPTATPWLITPIMPATSTQAPSQTPLPSPPPTVAPVEGVTSSQVNVRAEPSTAGEVLGVIPPNTKVEITGKDPGESWWQINYPQAEDGKGWITAQFVTAASQSEVPMIGGSPADPNARNVAVVQQQINVRSGPGTDFNALGTLNAQDVVRLTGKDPNGAWLQIEFAVGPEGKGWVNAAFVQAQGAENLPIITETGQVVGTGTPTEIPFTPTATRQPALVDGDSAASPSIHVVLSASGTQSLQYSSDVSYPAGDPEDWLQFVPYTRSVLLEVSCKGSDVEVEVNQAGQNLAQADCTTDKLISVKPGSSVEVHIRALSESAQNYSFYTVRITTP